MLTARTRCAVGVDTQIGGVDFDFDGIVDFGIDEHGGKRGVAFVVRIKRRVTHEAVNAGFRAQEAVGVFAFQTDGGAVDACDFAVVFFEDVDFEAFTLGVAAVHAEQHTRPIFGFGTACACGNVDKAVVRVGRLVEHALEFQIRHLFFQPGHIGDNGGKSVFVILFHHHVDEFAVVGNAVFDVVQRQYDAFQQFALFADVLGALGVVPQFRVFGQADHFF